MTGAIDQRIYIWTRPDANKALIHWSLNVRSTVDGVIAFKDIEIYNPELVLPEPQPIEFRRYQYAIPGRRVIDNRNTATRFGGFSVVNGAVSGAGIGSFTSAYDPLYHAENDAFLLASLSYDVIGPGSTHLFLQIGDYGLVNAGEESRDQNVVLGDVDDPAINAGDGVAAFDGARWILDTGRGIDSATRDARIVAYGAPVELSRQSARTDNFTANHSTLNLGRSAAVYDEYLVVGATTLHEGYGPVFVYQRDGNAWVKEAELMPQDETSAIAYRFGGSVAVWGDHLIVGAPGYGLDSRGSGAAYFFHRNGASWTETVRFEPSDVSAEDGFGTAIAANGDWVSVGAPRHAHDGLRSGAAYILAKSGSAWHQVAELVPSDPADDIQYGGSVSVSGDRIVVGAERQAGLTEASGAVYVFERDGSVWSEVAKLVGSDGQAGDGFGGSVAVRGDQIVVGASGQDLFGEDSGAAFVFEKQDSDWVEVAKLVLPDGSKEDWFGASVALTEDRVLVSAPGDVAGSVRVFEKSSATWQEVGELRATDGKRGIRLGRSLAVWGDTVIAGAPSAGVEENGRWFYGTGAVYSFDAPLEYSARLVTASPVSISQSVDTPAESYELTLDYRFLTPNGTLDVFLDDSLLGTVSAAAGRLDVFSSASFTIADDLLGRSDVELRFVLDGPAGSTLLLDQIGYTALVNGGFQTRDVSGWTVMVSPGGSVNAVPSAIVPEPTGRVISLIGLAALCGIYCRRAR